MSIKRYAAKRDTNEDRIVEALRMIPDCAVVKISAANVPDLLVSRAGINYLLEVKTAKGKLTPGQQAFFDTWPGQCAVVRTVDDALRVIGVSQ